MGGLWFNAFTAVGLTLFLFEAVMMMAMRA